MKKSVISKREVFIFIACMFGVVAGLQIDKAIDRNRAVESLTKSVPFDGVVNSVSSDGSGTMTLDFREAAKKILPSVVSIDAVGVQEDLFGFQRTVAEQGSGVIINSEGYVITNAHVVADVARGTQITIQTSDNRSFPAKIIGVDVRSDLAVIKTDAKGLVAATIGSSKDLAVGEWVLAVGNPLGQSNTLSAGVVSNIGRDMETPNGWLLNTIQTDAAINPGNSGGALTNAKGEVVGINSAIISTTRASVGLGFAIPIDRAKPIIAELIAKGKVEYAEIGIVTPERQGLLQTEYFRRMYETELGAAPPANGMVIYNVNRNSPAAEAGILQYDVITAVNGQDVKDRQDYTKLTNLLRPGNTVSMTIFSKGKIREINLTLKKTFEN